MPKRFWVWIYAIQIFVIWAGFMVFCKSLLLDQIGGVAGSFVWLMVVAYAIYFLIRLVKRVNFSYDAGEELGREYQRMIISGHF